MNLISNKFFRLTLLFIILAEILSFFSWYLDFPYLRITLFFVIAVLALVLALIKLEYGLYLLLAELFIGSKGYLFFLEAGGILVSLRIGLFLVIIAVWLFRLIQKKVRFNFRSSNFFIFYILFFIFLVWGVAAGFWFGNSADNIFFDANGWLYFALVFVFFSIIAQRSNLPRSLTSPRVRPSKMEAKGSDLPAGSSQPSADSYEQSQGSDPSSKFKRVAALQKEEIRYPIIPNILTLLAAVVVWLALKTLFLFCVFAWNFELIMPALYQWLEITGVGEITYAGANFWRVFIQSQLFCLAGFFIFLSLWIKARGPTSTPLFLGRDRTSPYSYIIFQKAGPFLVGCAALPLLISFSRSFWLGLVVGLLIFFSILKFTQHFSWPKIFRWAGRIVLIIALSFVFIYCIVTLPSWRAGGGFGTLVERRLTTLEEPAASSRINQLGPLLKKIIRHPIVGSGFGTTVTYRSDDPRILERDATSQVTTYAFEWGYLDIWLKIGLAGLFVYLFLLWKIWQAGWKLARQSPGLVLGLLMGLIAICVTSITSPYLNHPLGIGYIILASVIIENEVQSPRRPISPTSDLDPAVSWKRSGLPIFSYIQ